MEEITNQAGNLNRREAIKAMAAAGGALAAAAFMPGKWTRPVVEAGVVPAHAQSTLPGITINILQACSDVGFVDFNYNDPAGLVTNDATVVAYVLPCDQTVYNGTLGDTGGHSGDGFTGAVSIDFFVANCTLNDLDTICIQLFVGSRYADDCGPLEFCD